MKSLFLKIITFIIIITFFIPKISKAQNNISIILDKLTIKKGYTLKSIDKNFTLGLWPGFASEDLNNVEVAINDFGRDFAVIQDNKNLISNLYEFEIKTLDFEKPYVLILNYDSENESEKAIYFYNQALNKWSEVKPSLIDKDKKIIKVMLKISYAKLAVLEEKPLIGKASWYKCVGGNYAASIKYPKKTFLKVTNLDNNKTVVVKVNDYGPDRNIHPDRVIDLDVVAFKKIADKHLGIINVKVEKL
ncbi:MAG: Rare lipoprotein A [Parcubacteria group bacterium Athens1014_10]|nr:MAG: Rare lipoprotein A [Parcubacteria group bacterium Athens1014_10]TSD06048.1 MAG: Rare lipoprotein A [Parcubacteria group bacterium Athens0714_12]